MHNAPGSIACTRSAERHSVASVCLAQLFFARYAVVVAVHLRAGTVAEKVSRFFARGHLRTMSSPVALELSGGRRRCRGRNHNSRRGARRRRGRGNRHGRRAVGTFVILQVRVPAQRGEYQQHGDVFHRVIPGCVALRPRAKLPRWNGVFVPP
jgi:hypothetical protein